jgi:hypothetical protein
VWALELRVRSNSQLTGAGDVRGLNSGCASGAGGAGGGGSTGSIQARGIVASDCDLLIRIGD